VRHTFSLCNFLRKNKNCFKSSPRGAVEIVLTKRREEKKINLNFICVSNYEHYKINKQHNRGACDVHDGK